MNMQVQNFTTATAIPATALTVETPEPIIALIEAYKAGLQNAKSMRGPISDEPYSSAEEVEEADAQFEAIAAITWQPPMDELLQSPPPIQTMKGAIAALNFAVAEYGICEGSMADALIPIVITYLEQFSRSQAAGASLAHPDAELLALANQLAPITRERKAIDAQIEPLLDQREIIHQSRIGLEFTSSEFDRLFGGHTEVRDRGKSTFDPVRIEDVPPLDTEGVHPMCFEWRTGYNQRLAELHKAARKWRKDLRDFDKASGLSRLERRDEELYNQDAPLKQMIRGIPAKTIAGLAVKAAIVKDEWPRLFSKPGDEMLVEEEAIHSLVNDLLAAVPTV